MNYGMRALVSIAASICIAFAFACSNELTRREIPTPSPPQPTPEPQVLRFPDDDSAHDSPIEWWYYNGHFESDNGSEYSFHFVVFQTQSDSATTRFHFGQAGITDVERETHTYLSSDGFGDSDATDGDGATNLLHLNLDNFALTIGLDGAHLLRAADADGNNGVQLRIGRSRDVMLHEGIGWMDWPFGWTYYYSYPRMSADGVLTLDGAEVDVTGEVWFDHQWGDFFVVGKPAGWQWFALHLDDGASLMVSEVRGADGDVIAVDGTLLSAEGVHRVLDAESDGISLKITDRWTSPATGGDYPAGWRLQIDSIGLDVLLSPTVHAQEVPAMPYGNKASAYWEGRVDVHETSSNEIVGVAFVELSGYVDPEPLGWRKQTE